MKQKRKQSDNLTGQGTYLKTNCEIITELLIANAWLYLTYCS